MHGRKLLPELAIRNEIGENPRDGEVLIIPESVVSNGEPLPVLQGNGPMLQVPRTCVVTLSRAVGLGISVTSLTRGDSETRFVAAFERFVLPTLNSTSTNLQSNEEAVSAIDAMDTGCATVVISKDTDLLWILALAGCMKGKGCLHVFAENFIDIDKFRGNLSMCGMDAISIACVYVLAGCDFTAGTYGISPEIYLKADVTYRKVLGAIGAYTITSKSELLTLLAYLEKHGFERLATASGKEELRQNWTEASCDGNEIRRRVISLFVSENTLGTKEWELDVRRYVVDTAKFAFKHVPPALHISLQACRVKFIVFKYWAETSTADLSSAVVQGCNIDSGFSPTCTVMLERDEDVAFLSNEMRSLIAKCDCNGKCNNRQCSCVRRAIKCTGCDCDSRKCENILTKVGLDMNTNHLSCDHRSAEEIETGTEHFDRKGAIVDTYV